MDDVSTLQRQLAEDSANEVPPFGALSVALALRMGAAATPHLRLHLEPSGATGFLALEALRYADAPEYALLPVSLRAAIHVNALRRHSFFNSWGLPGFQLTETSLAIIALGGGAVPSLAPLLLERRSAPLSGSEDATTSNTYANRVCDYAWVLISEILGRRYTYSKSPGARDREIGKLRVVLRKQKQD